MSKFTSGEALAQALEHNDWVPSKTTEKTMAIMAGLSDIPWDKLKLFTLRWEAIEGEIVPLMNIMMRGENDDSEANIEVHIPDYEDSEEYQALIKEE